MPVLCLSPSFFVQVGAVRKVQIRKPRTEPQHLHVWWQESGQTGWIQCVIAAISLGGTWNWRILSALAHQTGCPKADDGFRQDQHRAFGGWRCPGPQRIAELDSDDSRGWPWPMAAKVPLLFFTDFNLSNHSDGGWQIGLADWLLSRACTGHGRHCKVHHAVCLGETAWRCWNVWAQPIPWVCLTLKSNKFAATWWPSRMMQAL